MTDERTPVEPGLQSEIISDVSATSAIPFGTETREPDRIARIKALAGRFHKNSTELVLAAYRLGLELKALRDESPYGQWEKRFDTDLTFISKRHANNFITLALKFKSEAELAGLTLTQALDAARCSPRNTPSRTRRAPDDECKSYVRKLSVFKTCLDRTELSEIGPRLAVQDRDEAIEYWTAIVQAGNEAIAQLERLRRSPWPCDSADDRCRTVDPSSGPGILSGKKKRHLGCTADHRKVRKPRGSRRTSPANGCPSKTLIRKGKKRGIKSTRDSRGRSAGVHGKVAGRAGVPGNTGPASRLTRFPFPPASAQRRGRLYSPCPRR